MKLFSKVYRLNLGATVIIFILSSISFFFLLRFVVISQFDESLQNERTDIERYVLQHKSLPPIAPVKDLVIKFEKAGAFEPTSFRTELAYDTVGQDHADFRKLSFSVQPRGQWYKITVGKSMENTEHLIHSIIAISVIAILLILSVSSLVNRILLRKLWQPFYMGLQLMKQYRVGKQHEIKFANADIDEFAEMQTVLQQATNKADKEYLTLKEFTENASHEMQTPLAVLRSRLDLIIQDDKVTSGHARSLSAMYKAIQGLTDLNQSLLLLTKIGNNQFVETRTSSITSLITERILLFEEIFQENKIRLQSTVDVDFDIEINSDLAGLLINNLFSNAVKHNFPGGMVRVQTLTNRRLCISNTGSVTALDQDKIFSRFYKAVPGANSTGLGLSIIKHICDVSNCRISYQFEKETHSFLLEWL